MSLLMNFVVNLKVKFIYENVNFIRQKLVDKWSVAQP